MTAAIRRFFALLILAGVPALGLSQEAMQEITVNPGDTMWSIANRYLKDPQRWPEIVKYNKLATADPTLALPGTKIQIPVLLIKDEYRNAQLIRMMPEVRYKRRDESEWKLATIDMTLKYEDSLRTMKGGQANILFPTKEEIQIKENSYVVLKPEKILQEVQIFQGDIRASRAKVIMPGGTVVRPRGMSSDYQAKVREDKSAVVFVYKGEVDVTAQGQTVRVREGFGTEVGVSKAPAEPQPLPTFKDFDPTELVNAGTAAAITGRAPAAATGAGVLPGAGPQPVQTAPAAGAPGVEGDAKVPEASPATAAPAGRSRSMVSENIMVNYQIQMAKTAKFETLVLEKTERIGQNFDIKKMDIPDGSYVMRIAFIDAFGVRGQWSAPTAVIKDTLAPEITNLTPENNQRFSGDESYCDVIGTVRDAAMVAVNGDLVFLSPTGRFTKFINLVPGKNEVTVLARDTQGNETVVRRTIEYKPSPSSR